MYSCLSSAVAWVLRIVLLVLCYKSPPTPETCYLGGCPFPIFNNAINLAGGIPMPFDTPHVSGTFWTSVSPNFTVYSSILPLCVSTTNILCTRPMIQNFLHCMLPHDSQRANLTYLCMGSISHSDNTTDLSHSNLPPCKQNSIWIPSSGQII